MCEGVLSSLDVVLKISALIGGALAVATYWRNAKVKRAEWLSSLYAKFFESSSFKSIRRILDTHENAPELQPLRTSLEADETSQIDEDFVDYLNFFEFVASLRKLDQLKTQEISMMFHYYLRLLCKHAFVRTYIRKHDFENLDQLLTECVPEAK